MDEINSVGDWRKVSILGSGGFGCVLLWRNIVTEETIAVKKCRWSMPEQIPDKQRKRWIQEVEFLKNIQHDNIVTYKPLPNILLNELNKSNLSKLPLLPMEYCTKGNLRYYLLLPMHSCGLFESDVRYILKDISSAIAYLHNLQIMHRDIKPENIVRQKTELRPNETIYKLIDLGYAKDMNSTVASFVGTLQYLAPEIFLNEEYTLTVDYWSFGVLIYEIICGIHPFLPKLNPIERIENISKKSDNDICIYTKSGEIIYNSEILQENHISSCLKKFMEEWLRIVLKYNPKERGIVSSGENVLDLLNQILDKKIITVFSVFNYDFYQYEVNEATLLKTLIGWLVVDTGISSEEQLLITDNMYYDQNDDRKVVQCLDEINSHTVLILFKKGAFLKVTEAQVPTVVKSLVKNIGKQYTWESLYVQMAHTVHYILKETKLMTSFGKAFCLLQDYLCSLHKRLSQTYKDLQTHANKLLIEIEFCKNINFNGSESNGANLGSNYFKKYRSHLWKCRELIENVNAVTARHAKLHTKQTILKTTAKQIETDVFNKDFHEIYVNATECLSFNKHKACITSNEIVKHISSCLKSRHSLLSNAIMKQYLLVAGKFLREINRLNKWMTSLINQMNKLAIEIQKNMQNVFHENAPCKSEAIYMSNENFSDDGVIYENVLPHCNDLISHNKEIRCNFQDILNKLLYSYKQLTESC